jgi:hypothetical protein
MTRSEVTTRRWNVIARRNVISRRKVIAHGKLIARRNNPAVGESPDYGRHVLPGGHLRDQLFDLTLGLVRRPLEERVSVPCGEVGCELGDPAQVKTPIAQHLEEDRVLAGRPGHGDPQVGLALREVKSPGAIREHRREGLTGVELPPAHFGDVRDEVLLDAAGLAEDLAQAAKEVVVGQSREWAARDGEG